MVRYDHSRFADSALALCVEEPPAARWPGWVRMLTIIGGGAMCWAAVLGPFVRS